LTILGGLFAAAVTAVLAHRFNSKRDHENRRSDLRIQYLLSAYRTVADTSERDLNSTPKDARAFEQGLSDIQLLGSNEQAVMAIDIANAMATNGEASLDDLLLSLRDDLRNELELEPMSRRPAHIRVIPNPVD